MPAGAPSAPRGLPYFAGLPAPCRGRHRAGFGAAGSIKRPFSMKTSCSARGAAGPLTMRFLLVSRSRRAFAIGLFSPLGSGRTFARAGRSSCSVAHGVRSPVQRGQAPLLLRIRRSAVRSAPDGQRVLTVPDVRRTVARTAASARCAIFQRATGAKRPGGRLGPFLQHLDESLGLLDADRAYVGAAGYCLHGRASAGPSAVRHCRAARPKSRTSGSGQRSALRGQRYQGRRVLRGQTVRPCKRCT